MRTILIGLIPVVLLRWAILRKPTSIGFAIGICFAILIGMLLLLEAMEMKSTTLLGAVAACSFFILRSDASKTSKDDTPKNIKPRFGHFLVASCCLICPAFAADDEPVLTNAVARDIGQTYGFYLGQSFLLDAIEQKFPDLAPQVRIAKLQFDASFGSSITNMDAVLARRDAEWSKVKSELRDKIVTTLGSQTLTPDSAKEFAETVAKRAKGEIPPPVIETLLTFHPSYISKPGSEFLDGFMARLTSDGSGKAKGVRFHLDYPKSWASADGNRPNIVRKFVSQNGRGSEMIMVYVQSLPFPQGQTPTDKEIEEMVAELATSKELKEMLPDGASFVAGDSLRLDGRPGLFQKYSLKQQYLDFTVSSLFVSYSVYYQTSKIQIQCAVGSEAKDEQGLKQRFDKFEPLFKLVANSFVIESQWK